MEFTAITRQIDWAEVRATAWHALQVAIVLTLLAGRLTRRGWDALPGLSERLGRAYAHLLVGSAPVAPRPVPADLQALTRRQLQQLTGVRRNLPKRELIALALA
jgi:hypothetical protein